MAKRGRRGSHSVHPATPEQTLERSLGFAQRLVQVLARLGRPGLGRTNRLPKQRRTSRHHGGGRVRKIPRRVYRGLTGGAEEGGRGLETTQDSLPRGLDSGSRRRSEEWKP